MKEIPLTQGKVALVDDEDYVRVCNLGKWQAMRGRYTWYARTDSYVIKKISTTILLHRFILDIHDKSRKLIGDHKDRNGLNCQKENLRIVTGTVSNANRKKLYTNSSGVTGVYWSDQKHMWHAEIRWEKKRYHLGFFNTVEEAAMARATKEKELCQF